MFVLRDTVQFASNLEDVGTMLRSANRTMKIFGGWASSEDNSFLGMEFAANYLDLYSDTNYTRYDN